MTCTWCNETAVDAGKAPPGVFGVTTLFACELHKNKIEKLKFIPVPIADIESAQRREEVLKKRKG